MTSETLFTFVLDHKGGTYISQVSGASIAIALEKWANTRTDYDLKIWKLSRKLLAELVKSGVPVALDACKNVWCLTHSSDEGLLLLNIIATESNSTTR